MVERSRDSGSEERLGPVPKRSRDCEAQGRSVAGIHGVSRKQRRDPCPLSAAHTSGISVLASFSVSRRDLWDGNDLNPHSSPATYSIACPRRDLPRQLRPALLHLASRQETPMTVGRSWCSLLPSVFTTVPQYLNPITVVLLALSEPDKRISHTSGSPVIHSASLHATKRVQVFADPQRGPADMQ